MFASTAFNLVARAATQDAAQDAAQAAIAHAVYEVTVELWTLYAVGVAVTLLRTYARGRAVGLKHLQADDYLVWVGIVRAPQSIPQHATLLLTLTLAVILHSPDGSGVQRGECCSWPRKQWHDKRPAGCAVPRQSGIPTQVCLSSQWTVEVRTESDY